MSYNYQQYGGNPYGRDEEQQQTSYGSAYGQSTGGYGSQNPYGQTSTGGYDRHADHGGNVVSQNAPSGYGSQSNPYATHAQTTTATTTAAQQPQPYRQTAGGYGQNPYDTTAHETHAPATANGQTGAAAALASPTVLSNQDFLARVEGIRSEIRQLTGNVSEIGTIHQRVLGSPDSSSSAQLERLVADTQVLNTRIKDQIKYLEGDAAKSNKNTTKDSQIRTLKQNFKSQIEDYQREEQTYRQRYRDQIARQYRIVNPEATEAEVKEATEADWGNEGVFQTALKSNRTGAANSVLGSVRARHNDIQKIENTLIELNKLFQDLAEQVVLQDEPIRQTEVQTENVKNDTAAGNVHLDKGIQSGRNRRKLKWICFWIVVLIIVILGLVLGLVFGLKNKS